MKNQEKSGVALKIIVVGGGLAGLATAYTLQKAGHEVLLLEKTDGTPSGPAGVQSPPNMTRVLNEWGLGPKLEKLAQQCHGVEMFSGINGDLIGIVLMREEFLKDLVAEFVFILHSDLQLLLLELATSEGVVFRYNSTVIDADGESGYVVLSTGEKLHADVIVGADGYNSILRSIVEGSCPMEMNSTPTGIREPKKSLILTYTIPAHLLRADDDLRPLVEDPSIWSCWLGDGYIAHANSLNSNQGHHYTVTVGHDYDGPIEEGDWGPEPDIYRYNFDFSGLEPRAIKLVSLTSANSSRIIRNRPYLESLVCDNSRIVLVGEAARPLMPGGNHTTALAIEDAQTLGLLFARIQTPSQVSRILTAYDEIRQPRSAFVHQYNAERQRMFRCPPGPEQQARDLRMRATLVQKEGDHINEANFKDPKMWGIELDLYAHDVTDKVNDWWGQWGALVSGDGHRTNGIAENHRHSLEVSIDRVTTL